MKVESERKRDGKVIDMTLKEWLLQLTSEEKDACINGPLLCQRRRTWQRKWIMQTWFKTHWTKL